MKKIAELTTEEVTEIKAEIEKRVYWWTPFTYYINNCTACYDCPKRLGSAICDFMYVFENSSCEVEPWRILKIKDTWYLRDLDIIWWYVNELWYDSKYDFWWKTTKWFMDDIIDYCFLWAEKLKLMYRWKYLDEDVKKIDVV